VQVTGGPEQDVTSCAAPAPHTTSPGRTGGRRPALRRGQPWFRRRPPWCLIAGPAVTLTLMLWGLTAPAYWGDEADTVSAVSRSLPQLLRMLRHADAVHGLYYLLLWPVARVLGTGELATRLPSAVAMAAAALGVAAIARRLASDRAALYAGLVFAALPMISAQGHDARPYGMVTAAAVLASYLLIRAIDDPRPRWFAAYGVSLVLLAYLELFGLFLIAAHAITLAGLRSRPGEGPMAGDPGTAHDGAGPGQNGPSTSPPRLATGPDLANHLGPTGGSGLAGRPAPARGKVPASGYGPASEGPASGYRPASDDLVGGYGGAGVGESGAAMTSRRRVVRGWLMTLAGVAIAVLPLVAYGWQQRVEIAWIARPSWHDVLSAAVSLAGGSAPLAVVLGLLAWLGWLLSGRPRPTPRRRAWQRWLAGLWSRAGGPDRRLTWLALPWLVLPPAMLLAASEIMPVYNFRYLVFCLPATAVLAGAGLAALTPVAPAPAEGYPLAPGGPGPGQWPRGPATSTPPPWPPGRGDIAPPNGDRQAPNAAGTSRATATTAPWALGRRNTAPADGFPQTPNGHGTPRGPVAPAASAPAPWPPALAASARPEGQQHNPGGHGVTRDDDGGRAVGRRGLSRVPGWAAPAVVLALIVGLVAPTQLSIRVPGTGMWAVSQFLAARERPGDAVIYPGSGVPPWYLAYPDGLGRLRDIWMAESGPASGRLYGLRVSTPVLEQREHGICRIWAAEMTPPWIAPAQYLPGYRLAAAWQPQPGVRLWLYARPGCAPAPGAGR
jgi:hypothetical protein